MSRVMWGATIMRIGAIILAISLAGYLGISAYGVVKFILNWPALDPLGLAISVLGTLTALAVIAVGFLLDTKGL